MSVKSFFFFFSKIHVDFCSQILRLTIAFMLSVFHVVWFFLHLTATLKWLHLTATLKWDNWHWTWTELIDTGVELRSLQTQTQLNPVHLVNHHSQRERISSLLTIKCLSPDMTALSRVQLMLFFHLNCLATTSQSSPQILLLLHLVPAPRSHPVLVTAGAVVSCCLSDHVTQPDALI